MHAVGRENESKYMRNWGVFRWARRKRGVKEDPPLCFKPVGLKQARPDYRTFQPVI